MFEARRDARIRGRALEWLEEQKSIHEEVLPRALLANGFEFEGSHLRLIGPQGIFKPRQLDVPLSITTIPDGPYADAVGADGLLRYRYRGTDPEHADNRGLRFACERKLPLVYFYRLTKGHYFASSPVFIEYDDRRC